LIQAVLGASRSKIQGRAAWPRGAETIAAGAKAGKMPALP